MTTKRTFFTFLLVALLLAPAGILAQEEEEADKNAFGDFDVGNVLDEKSTLSALLGYTNIGGQNYIGMRLQPELALGKLGIGLDVPLLFSLNGEGFRTEEFTSGVGWLRMIRYVRWGVKKRDPVYVRLGDLSGSWIGYGILLDNYTNSTSYEKRKLGITWDILVKNVFGVEGLYSDIDSKSFNLLAIRPYVKPLGATDIPIFRTIDIGFTYITDHDNTEVTTEKHTYAANQYIKDGVSAWAIDVGIMPLNTSFMQLKLYAQYGSLAKNKSTEFEEYRKNLTNEMAENAENYKRGSGMGIGADFRFKLLGNVLRIDSRLERLWYKQYFMPQFFNAAYEMNKDVRYETLLNANAKRGVFGSLSVTALDRIRVGGSLMIPDNVSESDPAIVTLNLDASRLTKKIILTGQYVKAGLADLKDAFKLDERSLLTVRAGYKVYKFLVVGVDYKWTWSVMEDGVLKANNYVTPYVGFHMPINLGRQDSEYED